MTDRELLEQIAAQVGTLTKELAGVRTNMATMEANMATKDELADVKSDLTRVKEIVVRIENDHGQKLGALFDGYKLNSDKLDQIENIVARHEETLLTKVK